MADKKRTIKLGGRGKTIISDYIVNQWEGLNTFFKDLTLLGDGQTPSELNWISGKFKDHIELRRGYKLLGTTRDDNAGRVSGLGIGQKADGTQVPFFTYDQKIKYYDTVTDNTIEINTVDVLPAKAKGEDVSIMPYQNIAGTFVYFTSPNSSIYKIAVANPADISDLKSTAFKGNAKIGHNRMEMWGIINAYGQKVNNIFTLGVRDKFNLSDYSQTTKEIVGTGNGSTQTFSGTLAYRSNTKLTCFFTEFGGQIAPGVSITNINKVSGATIVAPGHGLSVGDAFIITNVSGMTEINNLLGIVTEVVDGDHVSTSIDSSSFTDYSSGGTITKVEYFKDDGNGNLSSSLGGTGTINYTTGAFTLNFNTIPIALTSLISQYYVENSTYNGIADFTIGTDNGKGKQFSQFNGGDIVGVFPFDNIDYVFHKIKTWYINNIDPDDTKATNLPYRDQLGIPYLRGGYATDEGIIILDNSKINQPIVKIIQVAPSSASGYISIQPFPVSDALDLSSNGFNKVAIFRWGDYDLMACAGSLNGVIQPTNTVLYIRNIYSGQWDVLDYSVSCLETYLGTLISGDGLSNNVFTLFSGFDDDSNLISNYYYTKVYDLGVQGLKRFNRFIAKGLIQSQQAYDIYLAFDNGSFVKYLTVKGDASYVNKGESVIVGNNTLGSQIVGGGGDVFTAYPYEVEFSFPTDDFEYVQVKFVATNIGYVQIDEFGFKDIRFKGRKLPPSRIVLSTTETINFPGIGEATIEDTFIVQ